MNNFSYSIPTTIHFGKGQISNLTELKDSGKKVLLAYGGGSIKRSGLFDETMKILSSADMQVYELSGVEPNPRIESVRRGVEICKAEGIEMVLGVGGGSVIDCAKVVAAGAKYDGDAWDLVIDPSKITSALPIYCVLTLAATGTEMDKFAVISDLTKNEKWGTASDFIKPIMSVMDPEYTYSVSRKQTSAGTADMMSHIFENYFTNVVGADVQARFCEGLLKTCIKYGPIALQEPNNYEARANLMWVSSMAINGLVSYGADVSWCVHPIEHELSAFYDITHGEGLAILTPVWMDFALSEKTLPKFAEYGVNVWNIDASLDDMVIAKEAIRCTREFFKTMNLPATLGEVGINETKHYEVMAKKAADGCVGSYVPLSPQDIMSIFEAAEK